jgi:hypothetical protein
MPPFREIASLPSAPRRSVRFVHVGAASREKNIELPGEALPSSAIRLIATAV